MRLLKQPLLLRKIKYSNNNDQKERETKQKIITRKYKKNTRSIFQESCTVFQKSGLACIVVNLTLI
jgi:hypothetical protein